MLEISFYHFMFSFKFIPNGTAKYLFFTLHYAHFLLSFLEGLSKFNVHIIISHYCGHHFLK